MMAKSFLYPPNFIIKIIMDGINAPINDNLHKVKNFWWYCGRGRSGGCGGRSGDWRVNVMAELGTEWRRWEEILVAKIWRKGKYM